MAAGSERGIAIVAALWAAAFLACIVGSVLQLVRAEAGVDRGRQEAAELGAIVDGAVNLTILALLAPTAAQWPVDGLPVSVPFAGHDVTVSVQDESGKIDLNATSRGTLQRLLSAAGMEAPAARQLAASIMDWPYRSRSNNEDQEHEEGGRGLRDARFQSVEDLQLVPGVTQEVYQRISPLVTVYAQTPWIDPAYASPLVLALFRDTDAAAEAALRRIEEERAGLRAPTPAAGVALGHAFTIIAELRTPTGARAVRTVIIRLTGEPRTPLLIYRWS